jgi:UDPglucose--hexose-1-phosphate uridylyltransferase
MPEYRKDPVTDRWVIISTGRADRPDDSLNENDESSNKVCPFCPGNEHHTPEEILAYRAKDTPNNSPGWWLRVIPNKFPALMGHLHAKRAGEGMYDKINGMGVHEVVIESPVHDDHIGTMDQDRIEEIMWAYRDRTIEIMQEPRIQYILIFKNYRAEAGASQEHPHSQVIAMPIIPKQVQEEIEGAKRYHEYKERCVFCDMIAQEKKDGERVVMESEMFMAILPYASRFPYEICVLPRDHACFFHDIQKNEVSDLAGLLKHTMNLLREELDDPPFNWILHTTPVQEEENAYYHWHLEIIPKMTRAAGFEWGSGFFINPCSPEEAGRNLLAHKPDIRDIRPA